MSRRWEVLEKHLPNYSSYAFGGSFAAAVATGATAAFFAAAFAALFFFVQPFCCASAIFLRLSGLTTRLAVLATAFFGPACFASVTGLAGFFFAAQRAF